MIHEKINIEIKGLTIKLLNIKQTKDYTALILLNDTIKKVVFKFEQISENNDHHYFKASERHFFNIENIHTYKEEDQTMLNSIACKLNYYLNGNKY